MTEEEFKNYKLSTGAKPIGEAPTTYDGIIGFLTSPYTPAIVAGMAYVAILAALNQSAS